MTEPPNPLADFRLPHLLILRHPPPLTWPSRRALIPLNPVVLLNLVLPQIILTILVLARATREGALVDLGRFRAVLQPAVLGHAALEPLWITLGAVPANIAA